MREKKLQKGQVTILTVALFIFLSLTAVLGIVNPVLRHMRVTTNLTNSRQSYYLSESGIEDAIYRLVQGMSVPNSYNLTLNGQSTGITVADVFPGKTITSRGDNKNFIRKTEAKVTLGTGISFHYGIQAGQGGFSLQNSSSVTGNIYSGGSIIGAGNYVYGDAISSGASGLVYGIHATGSIYAHTLGNSSQTTYTDKDAFYATSKTNTVVSGTSYPNSPDLPTVPLPITDAQIAQWESDAEAGGTITSSSCSGGTYTVSSSMTLGPKKIECDLLVKGNGVVLTIAGPIWVTGNITTQTGPVIKMASSLGSQNVAFIADDPANRSSGSLFTFGQNTTFLGSGSSNSFVFAISMNNSAENGGTLNAIDMGQSAGAAVVYASHGQITLGQSVNVKEVTAYKIKLINTANVTYDTGLPSTLFQAGPSGGYEISSWKEIQ
jgi:hypothetical protein